MSIKAQHHICDGRWPIVNAYRLINGWQFIINLLMCVNYPLHAATIDLPGMEASAAGIFTPVEEQRIGRAFMRGVRQSLPLVDEPLLNSYINALGQRIVSSSLERPQRFYFFLIDKPEINAFAGPDGNIGVYSGLILASESESELAAVLAHEITHVTQNHLARNFEDASNMTIPAAAMLLAAVILGSQAGTDVGIAAAAGIQAAALQRRIDFTRDNEHEADAIGIKLLAAAGFDPYAMPSFFGRLAKASRLYANNAPEFLRTHPVTGNRIADAVARADAYPYRQHESAIEYFLARAALRQQSFPEPRLAVQHFAATLANKRYRQEAAERYGYALALLAAHKIAEAHQQAQQLLRENPTNIAYILVNAKVAAAGGNVTQAWQLVADALELFPGNVPLASYYAQLSLQHGMAAQAVKAMDAALQHHRDDPGLYELRSRLAVAVGQPAQAHLFLAESKVLNGDVDAAVQQLGAALRSEKFDDYAELQLRSRLRVLQQELVADKTAKRWGRVGK